METARWPALYPKLAINVYAPRFYHKYEYGKKQDEYSAQIVKGKHEDLSKYFFKRVNAVFRNMNYNPDLIVVLPSSRIGQFSPTLIELGNMLEKKHGIKNLNIIERITEGKKHTDCIGYQERFIATEGSLRVTCPLKGEKILLLDDTKTTGMTFLECDKILRNAGASEVIALCLGINQSRQVRARRKC